MTPLGTVIHTTPDPHDIITAAQRIQRMMPWLTYEDAERVAVAAIVFGVADSDIQFFLKEAQK